MRGAWVRLPVLLAGEAQGGQGKAARLYVLVQLADPGPGRQADGVARARRASFVFDTLAATGITGHSLGQRRRSPRP